MAHEFVYTMQDVGKVVGVDRVILEGITLAFFPGAKIGVLGANGAGKSSLLRIMAGLDDDHLGEARPTPGVRVGHLAQEPALDPGKTVLRLFELPEIPCEAIDRVLLNEVARCEDVSGAVPGCTATVETYSRSKPGFFK